MFSRLAQAFNVAQVVSKNDRFWTLRCKPMVLTKADCKIPSVILPTGSFYLMLT